MKKMLILFTLALLSSFAYSQNFNLLAGGMVGFINGQEAYMPEAKIRYTADAEEVGIRLETGYRLQMTFDDVLKYQQAFVGAQIYVVPFPKWKLLGGVNVLWEKEDDDGPKELHTVNPWNDDLEGFFALEFSPFKWVELSIYNASQLDSWIHGGLKVLIKL